MPGVPREIISSGPGTRCLFHFKNRFGASVVRSYYSYGGERGLFEIGIIAFEGESSGLATTILNPDGDVFGHLTADEALALILKISKLEPCQGQKNAPVIPPKIDSDGNFISALSGNESDEK